MAGIVYQAPFDKIFFCYLETVFVCKTFNSLCCFMQLFFKVLYTADPTDNTPGFSGLKLVCHYYIL